MANADFWLLQWTCNKLPLLFPKQNLIPSLLGSETSDTDKTYQDMHPRKISSFYPLSAVYWCPRWKHSCVICLRYQGVTKWNFYKWCFVTFVFFYTHFLIEQLVFMQNYIKFLDGFEWLYIVLYDLQLCTLMYLTLSCSTDSHSRNLSVPVLTDYEKSVGISMWWNI